MNKISFLQFGMLTLSTLFLVACHNYPVVDDSQESSVNTSTGVPARKAKPNQPLVEQKDLDKKPVVKGLPGIEKAEENKNLQVPLVDKKQGGAGQANLAITKKSVTKTDTVIQEREREKGKVTKKTIKVNPAASSAKQTLIDKKRETLDFSKDDVQPAKPKVSYENQKPKLYLRGGFNGWGVDNPFVHKNGDIYQVTALIAPGNHEFKLASNDWKKQWLVSNSNGSSIVLNRQYSLLNSNGDGSFLFVREGGRYLFTVDFSSADKAGLLISKIADLEKEVVQPHKDKTFVETKEITTWDNKVQQVIFSVDNINEKFRHYSHSTSQVLRDPIVQHTNYSELKGYPRVRSGSLQFDALFVLAMNEMRLNSVSDIRDSNYNSGKDIPCECFETGEKWHYVWTRDVSYASHLSLAMLDPGRARNSLEFKLSKYRDGVKKANHIPGSKEGLQIVQDTGSGGSWPISTDRVSWAFGANALLKYLPPEERDYFSHKAYQALLNTIEIDRIAAFDGRDGLYKGEQSFLDWREQSYPMWITDDIASIGSSKSLSTNVGHYSALMLASRLASEQNDHVSSIKYNDWALDLKSNINKYFWLAEQGIYSSMITGHFDGTALHKYDWLSISLAIISGIANNDRARKSLENYPHGPMGAPVIFPQQPDIPIYHNRAIWPFVTAYGLQAATLVKNSRVADQAYNTLIRSAALNLSNMENFEWLSGLPLLLDEVNPGLSGPVINSKRQLWSVAGYLNMVINSLFGVRTTNMGISFQPFITTFMRKEYFSESDTIKLHDLILNNKNINIEIKLPAISNNQGYYPIEHILLNGKTINGEVLWQELRKSNKVIVQLGAWIDDGQKITHVTGSPYETENSRLFAPREVTINKQTSADHRVNFSIIDNKNKELVNYHMYRNGEKIGVVEQNNRLEADDLLHYDGSACYSVSTRFLASGTSSHHSIPVCLGYSEQIAINDPRVSLTQDKSSKINIDSSEKSIINDWGGANDTMEVSEININSGGEYGFQIKYRNHSNAINLGITNGVKSIRLLDQSNTVIASGVVQMPHSKVSDHAQFWAYSTPFIVTIPEGKYQLQLADFINMSYLESNIAYTDNGGKNGPINRFDLGAVKVTKISDRH